MAIPRYAPPLERIKEEYARMVQRRVMAKRRPPRPQPKAPIPDNSTPWVENPKTIGELMEIAKSVQALVDKWGPKNQNT